MGDVLGGIAQGVGSYMGAQAEAKAAAKATDAAQQGYRYLTGSSAANNYINTGSNALNSQSGVQNTLAGLLGIGGDPQAAQDAFNQYKDSTGYQFQLGQGTQAINANAASKGLLQSGANAKALEGYGQNLASTTFNNYLSQLGGLNAAYGSTAQQGSNMLGTIGSVGTASGSNAAGAIMQGGNAQGNFWTGLGGAASGLLSGGAGSGFGSGFGSIVDPSWGSTSGSARLG